MNQIAAARQADRVAEAANRRLVRQALAGRPAPKTAGQPARRARLLRLPLWRRARLAS